MVNRRDFIAANVMVLAGTALQAAPISGSAAMAAAEQEGKSASSGPHRDFWNDWPGYITAQVNQAGQRRRSLLAQMQSRSDVSERATAVRSQLWEILGGRPAETPLNARTVGTIERDGYRIEKLIYESLPEVYVTAHLYLPTRGKPAYPAILAPLGHTRDGKSYRNYQYCYQNLARKGYVVLAYDPYGQGERSQYLDRTTGRPRLGVTEEHTQAGRPMLLLGTGLARYRVWDGIRSLDYLASRSEVDPHRIGCTGHSGGATVTMYLMALEPRILAAVTVEGNYENVAGPNFNPPGAIADAEQNIVGSLSRGLDRGDLLNAFAPKPFLLCYTEHDQGQTYSPVYEEAIAENYNALMKVYGMFGAKDRVAVRAGHLPHELDYFSRRAVYEWFNRWLGNRDAGLDEAPFDAASDEELNCTTTGQVLTSLGGRSLVQIIRDRAKEIIPSSTLNKDLAAALHPIRSKLTTLLALPAERSPLRVATLSSQEGAGLHIEEFQIEAEPGVRVVGWLVQSANHAGKRPMVLYISESGVNQVVAEPSPLQTILEQGHALCSINLRGMGLSTPRMPKAGPAFYHGMELVDRFAWTNLVLGKPVIGQRVWDILRTLDYLETRPDVDSSQIRILGRGSAAIAAGMATLLDERIRSILIRGAIPSYQSIIDVEDYTVSLDWFVPGILEHFDLPDILGAAHPRPVWICDAVDGEGKMMTESKVREHYLRRIVGDSPAYRTLQFQTESKSENELYNQWLRNT